MSRWRRLIGIRPTLSTDQEERIARWRALPALNEDAPFEQMRWCVVDVESSGLDVRRDRLIAIGAVPVEATRIVIGEAFRRVLRQRSPSNAQNIVIHRISGTEQLDGDEPADVLFDFLEYIGKSTLVAFHARFDELMIRRAMLNVLGVRIRCRWLDLAVLAPALHPETLATRRSLDDWLARYGIVAYQRHDALADAVATAQLLQVMFERAREKGITRASELFTIAENQRWLGL
jgi:DNA polymerase III subunit epsilon